MTLLLPTLLVVPPVGAAVVDSYEVESVPFARATLTPSAAVVTLPDNAVTGAISMGFRTEFFGTPTDLFWIGSNGFVTFHFVTPDGCCQGQPMPTPGGPDGILAALWTDLDPGAGGSIRHELLTALPGRGASQMRVIDFQNVPARATGIQQTFQVQVYDSGILEVHYASANANDATVGAEDINGAVGVEVQRGTVTRTNDALRFTPVQTGEPDPLTITSVSPAAARPGFSVEILGTGFESSTSVRFGSVTAPTNFFSSTRMFAIVPNMPPGVVDLTLANPDGNSTTVPGGFRVLDPAATNYRLEQTSFDFVPLTPNATILPLGDDQVSDAFPLGFSTQFFDLSTDLFWVSSNGFVPMLFRTGPGCCEGQPLPRAGDPDGIVAAFWTDLAPGENSSIRFERVDDGGVQRMVIEWNGMVVLGGANTATFQVHVRSDGTYDVHYRNATAGPTNVTIGIEDASGENGLLGIRTDALSLTDLGIRFVRDSAPPFRVDSVSPSSGAPGDLVTITGSGLATATVRIASTNAAFAETPTDTRLVVVVPDVPVGPTTLDVSPSNGSPGLALPFEVLGRAGLTLSAVAPSEGRAGDVLTLVGTGMGPDVTVHIGGTPAGVISASSTQMQAIVPEGLAAGTHDVTVSRGNAGAILLQAFTLLQGPAISGLDRSTVAHGETLKILGRALSANAGVVIGGVPVDVIAGGASSISVLVNDLVPTGIQDVTVLVNGHSDTLRGAILVRGAPDLVVETLEIERRSVETGIFSVAADAVLGNTVRAFVTNHGTQTANDVVVKLSARTAEASFDALGRGASAPAEFASVTIGTLRPGESREVEATWRPKTSAGDWIVRASANGATPDARPHDNVREARAFVLVGGVRAVTLCDARTVALGSCPPPPPVMEQRTTETRSTFARDDHTAASVNFVIDMTTPVFDFSRPDFIFDTETENPDGSHTFCTVWRFTRAGGDFFVAMEPSNAVGAAVLVPQAAGRTAAGSTVVHHRQSLFVLGVEVDRFEQEVSNEDATPRDRYETPPMSTIRVFAEDPIGDFARCRTQFDDGSRVERFTFAALPADVTQAAPNVSGVGAIGHLIVFYAESVDSSQSTVFGDLSGVSQ